MSVIFGKYHIDNKVISETNLIEIENNLNNLVFDDKNMWIDRYIGFGSLMLYHTPESLNEKLPFKSNYSGNIITADARIDNRDELFVKLKITDQNVSDSTLILACYDKYGKDCVQHLIGDFAFAIWDVHKEELFCARDHMGIKPFYFFYEKNTFAFCSLVSGLKITENPKLILQNQFKYNFVSEINIDYSSSPFKKIKILPPASFLFVNKNDFVIKSYWSFLQKENYKNYSEEDFLSQFNFLLNQSIEARMRSSYPIGSELSGGLDSSLITSLIQKKLSKTEDLRTFSFISPNHYKKMQSDDTKIINEVLASSNIKYNYRLSLTGRNYLEDIKKLIMEQSSPLVFEANLLTKVTFENANLNNVRTIFSGTFGDQGVSWRMNPYPEWLSKGYAYKVYKDLKIKSSNVNKDFAKSLYSFALKRHRKLLEEYNPMLLSKDYRKFVDKIPKNKSVNYLGGENTVYRQKRLLNIIQPKAFQETISGYHYGVNIVYPLLDIRLLEYFLFLPINQKYRLGVNRFLFRKAASGKVPAVITKGAKSSVVSIPDKFFYFLENKRNVLDYLAKKENSGEYEWLNFQYLKRYISELNYDNKKKLSPIFLALSYFYFIDEN